MTVWEDVRSWGARDWDAFLRRAALEPRTYCLLFALGFAGAFLGGACNGWSDENLRIALAMNAVAMISL
jgi:hypothetical protein